jgi:hypothetical protein
MDCVWKLCPQNFPELIPSCLRVFAPFHLSPPLHVFRFLIDSIPLEDAEKSAKERFKDNEDAQKELPEILSYLKDALNSTRTNIAQASTHAINYINRPVRKTFISS